MSAYRRRGPYLPDRLEVATKKVSDTWAAADRLARRTVRRLRGEPDRDLVRKVLYPVVSMWLTQDTESAVRLGDLIRERGGDPPEGRLAMARLVGDRFAYDDRLLDEVVQVLASPSAQPDHSGPLGVGWLKSSLTTRHGLSESTVESILDLTGRLKLANRRGLPGLVFVGPVGSGKQPTALGMAAALGLRGTRGVAGNLRVPITDIASRAGYLDLCLSLTAEGCLMITDLHAQRSLWDPDLNWFVDALRRTWHEPSIHGRRLVVVLARTEREAHQFKALHPDLAWLFPLPLVRFEPIDTEALAVRMRAPSGAVATEMVEALRRQPGWSGTRTVDIVRDLLPHTACLDEDRYRALIPTGQFDEARVDAVMAKGNGLVGVEELKEAMAEVIASARLNNRRAAAGLDPLGRVGHMCFEGEPGTGKTTAARLFGELLHAVGITTQPDVVEVTRADLIGEYIGQTAPMVRGVYDRAKGGVLFIDEAYALTPAGLLDFANEAIAELVALMEQDRSTIVIFAGYPEPMAEFIAANPGLSSRITRTVTFEPLTVDQRVEMFRALAQEHHLTLTHEAASLVRSNVEAIDSLGLTGGARLMRVLFERTCARLALRVTAGGDATLVSVDDIEPIVVSTLTDDPGLSGYL